MKKHSKTESGNYTIPIVILSLIIIGSLAYFGSFWYKTLNPRVDQSETLADEDTLVKSEETINANVPQTEIPSIELFVMSHCPYGTQIEKGILPVLELLGDKIDFELKFVNYAMHGKVELDEQLTQYCIQENEPQKLTSYLKCFLEEGESDPCLLSSEINTAVLDTCVKETDSEYEVTALYEDESTWKNGVYPQFNVHLEENESYRIKGSPMLVLNRVIVNSERDPNSLLATICSGFENQPEECTQKLSSDVPVPGFGYGTLEGSTEATCN
jgi:hypothetical protein